MAKQELHKCESLSGALSLNVVNTWKQDKHNIPHFWTGTVSELLG